MFDENTVIYYFCCCTNIFLRIMFIKCISKIYKQKMQITNNNEIGTLGVFTVLIVSVTQQNY